MRFAITVLTIVLTSAMSIANAQTPTAATRSKPIGVGEVAPDFTLQSHSALKVNLSESRGKRPVVLVFYRGYW